MWTGTCSRLKAIVCTFPLPHLRRLVSDPQINFAPLGDFSPLFRRRDLAAATFRPCQSEYITSLINQIVAIEQVIVMPVRLRWGVPGDAVYQISADDGRCRCLRYSKRHLQELSSQVLVKQN
jgi:hypothetical protein